VRIAEVCRFDGDREQIVIERLTDDGSYRSVEVSEFLPVRTEEVGCWVLEEDFRDGSALARRLRAWAWVRAEVAPRLAR